MCDNTLSVISEKREGVAVEMMGVVQGTIFTFMGNKCFERLCMNNYFVIKIKHRTLIDGICSLSCTELALLSQNKSISCVSA